MKGRKDLRYKVLIVGAVYGGIDPVSSIMQGVLDKIDKNKYEVYCLGFDIQNTKHNNKYNLSIHSPFSGYSLVSLFYRTKRKIMHILNIDDCIISADYVFNNLIKLTKGTQFDLVLGVSGRFCFVEAAYRYAKLSNTKFRVMYFDPFVENYFTKNKNYRISIQKNWIELAEKLFYNLENQNDSVLVIKQSSCKMIGFKIPIFERNLHGWSLNDNFLYGGSFYKDIRSPECLYHFSEKLVGTKYRIACYSNLLKHPDGMPIDFFSFVGKEAFNKLCLSTRAFIYIGNSSSESTSSKYLEYIAYKKPIIGINVDKSDEVRKYEFFYDGEDIVDLSFFDNLSTISMLEYDPYFVYSDRDPVSLAVELISGL